MLSNLSKLSFTTLSILFGNSPKKQDKNNLNFELIVGDKICNGSFLTNLISFLYICLSSSNTPIP